MDPVIRVREYLLDNIGHMTYPRNASLEPALQRWFVPIYCRTWQGAVVVGDGEVDQQGHIIFAPGREQMLARLIPSSSETFMAGATPVQIVSSPAIPVSNECKLEPRQGRPQRSRPQQDEAS